MDGAGAGVLLVRRVWVDLLRLVASGCRAPARR